MHVKLDNPYSGFLRQFRRTRAIKRLASVSIAFFCRIFPNLRSWMPPQRQRHQLTTEELSRVMGILECGSSQQGLSSSLVWAKVWHPEHGIASRPLDQLPSAMLVVDNDQPRQYRTDFLWCRPDVIHSWMRLLFEMSWGMLLELTFPRKKFITVFNGVAFGLEENALAFPWPDFTNRCVWTGHEITSTGLITIEILYSSPMSNGTVLTLQIDVFDCGEDVGSDFKMPICLNMTAMEEAPSWCGLISAEVDEQTHTSW